MITKNFKIILNNIQLNESQISVIEDYLSKNKVKVSPDTIEYADGSIFYSEKYVKEMMERAYRNGKNDGIRKPTVHIAEMKMISCIKCGYNINEE